MELVPDEASPGFGQRGGRVRQTSQPVGRNGGQFGSGGQLFVAAVEQFHFGMRGVTTHSVAFHQ